MINASKQLVYEFDGFRLDAAKLMLYRRGEEVFLPRKTVETLVVLIEKRGEIVAKDELMEKVWAGSFVEESNLSQHIYQLRKTLGNHADGKAFIETFRRRGYRFNGEVRVAKISSSAAASAPPQIAQISTASGYDVERRGNVLQLVEWKDAEKEPAKSAASAETSVAAPSRAPSIRKPAIFAVCAALALIAALFYFQRRSAPNAETRARAKNELTFLRLTNGSAPVDATISPDGKYFVYHEQDGATARLWLQQTGQSSRIEIIPPAERLIHGKTFSPDGTFVYFIAQDNADAPRVLYRVPTLGGAPVRILENIYSPPSFSPDGSEIVFQRINEKTLDTSLVTADLKGVERVLLAWTNEQGLLSCPAWSPDGNRIAFGAFYHDGAVIDALNPQTGALEALSPEKWDNVYRMLWTRDGAGLVFTGTKIAEGSTTRRDQIYYLSVATGEARRLTTDGNRHQINSLGVTDADEILAVPFNRSSQIWQMNAGGDARTAVQITNGLADGRAGLAALPNGRLVYVARLGEHQSVWSADGDGANQKQLTYEPSILEEVRAAPDGRFLVFSARHGNFNQLFQINPDGTNLRQLTFDDAYKVDSAVSPDGNWIIYDAEVFSKTTLGKIPSAGGAPVSLTDFECRSPNYSPDGKFVSCIYEENKIAVVSPEDGKLIKVFEPVQIPYFNPGARFSPDGRNLIYIARRKNFSNLWRQPLDGGAPQRLTDFTNGEIHNFAFSSDGARLYVARGFEVRDVMLIKNFR